MRFLGKGQHPSRPATGSGEAL